MDPKQLSLTSPKLSFLSSSSSFTPLPFFISNKLHFLQKPNFSLKLHSSLKKSQFLGTNLRLFQSNSSHVGGTRFNKIMPISAAVKRRKELPFDNVIQKDKKLKFVLKVRKILVSKPTRVMSLQELGKYRRELGLDKKRKLIVILRRFPGVFEIVEDGCYSLKFKMTSEAEKLYLEELRVRNEMEDVVVTKLRKLLMMPLEKRILLEKIGHLANDLGLPREFRDTICHRYPEFFKVVQTERGPALELTHWDPHLAVSAAELSAEENRIREVEEQNLIIDRAPKFNRVKLPKGLSLSKGEMRKIMQFRDIPYISPYSDFSMIGLNTPEKEKHACGVIHEILSLTLEKRTLVDNFTHFREEFRFSQQLRGMLIRHPDMFYISLKGDRDSVFLREAYRDSQLVDKDRLLLVKEKLRSLVDIPRFPKGRGAGRTRDGDGMGENDIENRQDESGEEEQEWSDADDLISDDDDDDDDIDDDWIDEDDDDSPPDFDDEEAETSEIEKRKTITRVQDARQNNEKVLVPSFPDGRTRERW
ncbi:putative plant organelle RNA recognition domain-containing protein [Medicago truncatula]|uniref:Plant organelle RNA recognition domain protein n=1 Tax=Medicago truncatula TaxID=3880 RepID=G7L432_MEDTR|nr:protein WHAT'S THIS FACTOR 1 homolog, chloroplastic [Medicago truncatula]AES82782.1 plant organelle RNA recognition domain protein [Medicago truncatula]RHN49536.1 putative plant organelle RNA recognition domain-containing protein [Medicago truncatula]